jgi:putative transposase
MSGNSSYYLRHLPHINPSGATFFVTFRLYGSLPLSVQRRLQQEQQALEQTVDLIEDENERIVERYRLAKLYFGRWDSALDGCQTGPAWLKDASVAAMLVDAFHYRHTQVYTLHAFCIMPNHVHMLYTPLPSEEGYYTLAKIMQSLKGYTARQANKMLSQQGSFWQDESYDHYVRNDDEYRRIVHYIRYNPVKAKLVNEPEEWPWTYIA